MYRAFHATKRDVIVHFSLQDPCAPLVKARSALEVARDGDFPLANWS